MQEENTEILRDFAFRLTGRADRMGLSQTEIAERMGMKLARVSNWFQGRNFPRKRERLDLAKLLGVNVEWLIQGLGDPDRIEEEPEPYMVGFREVPVISWSHAGEATTYEELPKHWQGSAPTSSTDKRAFAVIVEGDCMEPKAAAGDRVIVEPSREPRNGHAVVAKLVDDAVQLRIYTKLPNGTIRLASMKPEIYPTLDYKASAFHWIYPVRELVRTM